MGIAELLSESHADCTVMFIVSIPIILKIFLLKHQLICNDPLVMFSIENSV